MTDDVGTDDSLKQACTCTVCAAVFVSAIRFCPLALLLESKNI